MNTSTPLARAIRLAIGGAVGLSAALIAPVASAQQAEALGEVVITGSRIRQNPLNEAAPVITLSTEDLQKTGQTSIGDILQHMPVSGGSVNTRYNFSGNQGFPPDGGGLGAGATTADLRHLGPKRVLVLVDGIRWVNEASASGVSAATDLNTIPASIIDHVEVLQDGASSIYGSDAIAGVINIITKKDFNGIEFSGYGGQYGQGDGSTDQWGVSLGSSSERSSSFFNLDYTKQGRVNSKDRAISQFPKPFATSCAAGGCSSGTPQGRFFFTDPNTGQGLNLTINDGVTGIPSYNPANPVAGPRTDDFHNFTVNDRFNFQPFNLMQTPSERIGLFGQGEYQLADNVSFFMKGLFNQRRSTNQAAPEPLFTGPEAGNGNLLDTIQLDVNNPYNPFGFTLNASTDTESGGTDYFIGRRPLEGGPRIFEQNVDTWYLGGGFRGDFQVADRDFYWDVTGVWSRNSASQTTHGSYNSRKLKEAMGPGVVAGIGGATTTACGPVVVVLGVPTVPDPIPGCVPFNIAGGQGDGSGTITQAMLDFIRPVLHDTSEQELKDITVNLGGTILSMPAGGLDFAVGFEHRDQSGFYLPDAIYTAGESAGVPSTPTSGQYDTNEFYGELQIPLLKERAGADLLQLTAAVRTSDYSTFGNQTASKFGLNWRPIKDLLFRGSYSEGIRAPSIGELFGSTARFDTTITDKCSDYAGLNGGPPADATTQANCLALGVPNTYEQFNPQISVTTGGNPALVPETTSNSYTAGFVYSPRWAEGSSWSDGLSFEFNYYNIELEKAIAALDAQVQLDGCVATLDPVLCGGIGRTQGGVINSFANQLLNIGGIRTNGWDLNIRWSAPEFNWGRFGVLWQTTHLNEYTEIIPTATGFQEVPLVGTETGDLGSVYPDWKSSMTVDWSRADWAASVSARYTDAVIDTNNAGAKMSATTYVDMQVTWTPSQFMDGSWDFTVGANNVFDEDPPPCFSCALNGYDPSGYDTPGVFLYARVVAHFGKDN
jgi:iron complex outermembrane receptor protein